MNVKEYFKLKDIKLFINNFIIIDKDNENIYLYKDTEQYIKKTYEEAGYFDSVPHWLRNIIDYDKAWEYVQEELDDDNTEYIIYRVGDWLTSALLSDIKINKNYTLEEYRF